MGIFVRTKFSSSSEFKCNSNALIFSLIRCQLSELHEFYNIPGNGNLPCFSTANTVDIPVTFDIIQDFKTLNYIIPVGYPLWVRVWVYPWVEFSQPVAIPIPLEWVRVQPKIPGGYPCQSLRTSRTSLRSLGHSLRTIYEGWKLFFFETGVCTGFL